VDSDVSYSDLLLEYKDKDFPREQQHWDGVTVKNDLLADIISNI